MVLSLDRLSLVSPRPFPIPFSPLLSSCRYSWGVERMAMADPSKMMATILRLVAPLILLILCVCLPVFADSTCSTSSPCPEGCCSTYGVCGYGPDFCAPGNCTNSCNVKSQCDPGDWGPQYAEAEVCSLNVCCSPYGFCGTTSEFCGNATVAEPSCSGTSSSGRTIGYYEGFAVMRPCDSKL